MLNFGTGALAPSYFLFAFLAVLGTLQLVAARHKLIGLSLIGGRRGAIWGYLLGAALLGGAFGWFFTTRWEDIFRPGLAGSELFVLFALASVGAVGFTLLLASLLYRPSVELKPCHAHAAGASTARATAFERRALGTTASACEVASARSPIAKAGVRLVPAASACEEVSFGQGQGMLYLPQDQRGPGPAICAVFSPESGPYALGLLAGALAREGFVVLAIGLGGQPRYPEVLALLPAAQALLARREEVDEDRLGVLGFDLGADLALRAASSDERVKAVVALAPLLQEASLRPGLSLLREMPYGQAIRWARHRARGEVLRELNPLGYTSKLAGRPLLVIYGQDDGLVPPERARRALAESGASAEVRVVPGERHLTLAHSPEVAHMVARWFKERI
ncbi:MAG: alpha/beta hydrolase family protein [Anaerolineae bacterium]